MGKITYTAANAWSSTFDDDGGAWVQGAHVVAMTLTTGNDSGKGCLFAGQLASTGQTIGSDSAPGAWICPGYGSRGTWFTS